MESALSTTTTTTRLTISKTIYLHCHFSTTRPIQSQFSRRIFNRNLHSLHRFTSSSPSSLRSLSAVVVHPVRSRLQCVSSSAASIASGAGGVGGIGGGGSGGGGGGGGGDGALEEKAGSVIDVFESSSDVIILDVAGMSCGGCSASVKRILESQPQVSSASVNLTTETVLVWPVSEAKVVPNWQKNLGVELAKHLTSCGFKSNLRGEGFTARAIPS